MFGRKRKQSDFNAEIEAHLALEAERLKEQGLSEDEARAAARRAFGNVTRAQERFYESSRWVWLDQFAQDVHYGLRQLCRNPGFTIVAVLTLALGVGANTAIFSLINAVMLNLLPVRSPERLVLLSCTGDISVVTSGGGNANAQPFSYPTFEEIRAHNQVFSSLFGFVQLGKPNVIIDGRASLAGGELVTGDYFSGLGVAPILGRAITDADEKPDAARVAVISYGYWSRRFGRNPAAVGKDITINRVPFTVAGVAPPGFFGVQPGHAVDVWAPIVEESKLLPYGMSSTPGGRALFTSTDWWWLKIMGRLKQGVTTQQAAAQVDVLFRQSISDVLKTHPPRVPPHIRLEPASRGLAMLRQEFSKPLWVLMTIVGVVLLIACANVAALLVARSSARQNEIAMRLALGASRGRLVRQLLSESVLLASLGGTLGLLFAGWGSHALLLLMSSGGHHLTLGVQLDARVLAFTAIVSMLTGILFGLAPALRSTRLDLTPALKVAGGGAPAAGQRTRLGVGNLLVIAQIALSLPLLIGAALFVRTLEDLENQNFGFDQHNLLLFGVDPSQQGYKGERLVDFYGRLLRRLQALPGVRSATASEEALLSGVQDNWDVSIQGVKPKSGQNMGIDWNNVGPSFFETMGIPLLAGRGVEWQDTASSPRVAVVNAAFARDFLDGRSPVGYKITFKNFFGKSPAFFSYEIVGMVQDAKYASLRKVPRPTVYAPYSQAPFTLWELHYELRTAGSPMALVPTARRAVRDLDPELPLSDVKTQTEQIGESLMQERFFSRLSAFFASLAALLACIGLYGSTAYSVTRRTHEIGIRMALGAGKADILRMVTWQGVKLTIIGVVIGIVGALALTRFLASLLYGVKPTDPLTFVAVSMILIAVALLACYIPGRRKWIRWWRCDVSSGGFIPPRKMAA